MRHLRLSAALAGIAVLCGATTLPPAHAAVASQYLTVPGASCQLSIPTTNTGVRPKAPGFRNESTTTSNFVICSVASPTDLDINFDPFDLVAIIIHSIDGMARNISCTAVTGNGLNSAYPLIYSTKTIEVPADTSQAAAPTWLSQDFGQPSSAQIKASSFTTITCNLPPQTEIRYMRARYQFEIGN